MTTASPNPPLLAPSILSADFTRLGEQVSQAVRAGADLIHVDVMDGHFVPNLSIGTTIVESLVKAGFQHLDVHLMVREPEKMIPWFLALARESSVGAVRATEGSPAPGGKPPSSEPCIYAMSFHIEAATDPLGAIRTIHDAGVLAGVAISPPTPLGALEPLLQAVDFFLVMSVNPGFGAQSFMPESVERVRTLRAWLSAAGLNSRIEVDGGINPQTARIMREAGADIFVAGNSIFGAPDIAAAMAALRSAVMS